MNQTIIVMDFGGPYKELISRKIRESNVLAVVKSCNTPIEQIKELNPIGIILTGGMDSVLDNNSPKCDKALFDIGVPILGICYGHQLISNMLGGQVVALPKVTEGIEGVSLDNNNALLKGMNSTEDLYISCSDNVVSLPVGFQVIGHSKSCSNAVIVNQEKNIYGVQFHPEVSLSKNGKQVIDNFLFGICGATGDYTLQGFLDKKIIEIRQQVGSKKVLLGLSGGVDSSVVASILSKAIPNQLVCIFVDHGLMRKNEGDEIQEVFGKKEMQFVRVNAQDRFLEALKGVDNPEEKRKIIGREFVRVFEEESNKFDNVQFLAQGTIYPDVIESGASNQANIKSHHNVGGLPKDIKFIGLVEPLRELFKDEVRKVGALLGLPQFLVDRQPFPGPGLGVRVMGEITKEKLDTLRDVDYIFRQEVEKLKKRPNQYFAVLTDTKSVGIHEGARKYNEVVALRAIYTTDFMTGEYVPIPHRALSKISARIMKEVKGVSRVVYDITGKPPATIEWE